MSGWSLLYLASHQAHLPLAGFYFFQGFLKWFRNGSTLFGRTIRPFVQIGDSCHTICWDGKQFDEPRLGGTEYELEALLGFNQRRLYFKLHSLALISANKNHDLVVALEAKDIGIAL